MSLARLFVRQVDIITPASSTDSRGDTVTTWTGAAETTVQGWLGRASESEAFTPGRDALRIDGVVRVPAGTVVDGRCRVRVDGDLFEVAGTPNRAWTPRGEHHVRIPVRRVDG